MKDDAISRQAAINAVENTDCELSSDAWDEITDAIMQVPSVQPERKKGHWIWITLSEYKCSECGHETTVDECMEKPMYNFCPYCNADMRGEQDG